MELLARQTHWNGSLAMCFVIFSAPHLAVFLNRTPLFSFGPGADEIFVLCEERLGVWDKKVLVAPSFVRCGCGCVRVLVYPLNPLANEKKSVRTFSLVFVWACAWKRAGNDVPLGVSRFLGPRECLAKTDVFVFDSG